MLNGWLHNSLMSYNSSPLLSDRTDSSADDTVNLADNMLTISADNSSLSTDYIFSAAPSIPLAHRFN